MIKKIELTNQLEQISVLADFIATTCEEMELEPGMEFQLSLVLEEAVSNVILYAFPHEEEHTFSVTIENETNHLTLQIKDNGIPFNPIAEAPEVDTNLGAEERRIGGLGIFLIQEYMDNVNYERTPDGYNILTLKKEL